MLKLILKTKEYYIPSDFQFLSDVNPNVYSQLMKEHQYKVKSMVSEEVFQSFINHWIKNETPNFCINNIMEYLKLSQEFDRMKDIVLMFNKITTNATLSILMSKKERLKEKIKIKNSKYESLRKRYHEITQSLFDNSQICFSNMPISSKAKLFSACQSNNLNYVNMLSQKRVYQNNLAFSLNLKEKTATLLGSLLPISHVYFPRSIQVDSQEFLLTKISECAFKDHQNLESVEFPMNSELIEIGDEAFYNSSLISIVIPSSVTKIGDSAFSYCSKIKKIEFAEKSKLKTIERSAFCFSSLQSLTIPSSVVELKEYWCSETSYLININVFDNGEKNISYFEDNYIIGKTDLKSDNYDVLLFARRDIMIAQIPSFIEEIASFAFDECRLLSDIKFTEDSKLRIVRDSAFSNSSIKQVLFPQHVTRIGKEAFIFCKQLFEISFSESSELISIGNLAFAESSIENLKIPSSIIELGNGWCSETSSLINITILENEIKNISYYDDKYIIGKSGSESFNILLFARRDIEIAEIPSFIEEIGPFAFDDCPDLFEVEFPANSKLRTIHGSAFYGSALQEIVIPPHVTKINERAFQRCNDLSIIEFSEQSELIQIDKYAFSYTSIESISIPEFVEEIKEAWLFESNKIKNIMINPKNEIISCIEPFIIQKSDRKSDIYDVLIMVQPKMEITTIPSSIKKIAPYAFASNSKINRIEFSDDSTLELINAKSFSDASIKEIFIPSSVKKIEYHAFDGCRNLKNVKFSTNSNLQLIEKFAFYRCAITGLFIPSNVIQIHEYAFSCCNNLKIIEISENSKLMSINCSAFRSSPVELIMIPANFDNLLPFYFAVP